MRQFLLIRHGLPHEGHATRADDPPLHADGHRHARRLARRLQAEGIDRIVCSPQQRAIDSAAPLAKLLGLQPEIFEGLAEVDRHCGRYRSADTIRAEEPGRWAEFLASPARFMGRDPEVYRDSVVAAFSAIVGDARGTRIAVFSHGMTIKTILCTALGLPEAVYARFSIAHCSVTRVSGSSMPELRIDSVNESLCALAKRPKAAGTGHAF